MPKPGVGSTAGVVVLIAVVLIAGCAEATPSTSTEEPGSSTTTISPANAADSSVPEETTKPTYVRETPLPEEIVERNTPEPSPEAEEAFFACLEEAGYTREDYNRFTPSAGEEMTSEDDPGHADRAAFTEVRTICVHESGVGYVAGFDPEFVAASNESVLINARCMQDLGWSDYPDPVPGEGDLLEPGLGPGTFSPPTDPEEKERFQSDREYCGTQSGILYFRE